MHSDAFIRWSPPAGPAPLKPLACVLAALDLAVGWILCAAMAVMVVVVGTQVALRYGFNSSLDWADEVARLAFVWSIFLGIAMAVKTGSHIGIELVVGKLHAPLRTGLARVVALVCAGAMLLVAWESAVVAYNQWDELMGAINASAAWFLVPLILGGIHGALHFVWIAIMGPPQSGADTGRE